MYKKLIAPSVIQIELTSRCTNKCIHCYNFWRGVHKEKNSEIHLKEAQILANEIISNKIFHAIITGGEPFLNRNSLYFLVKTLISNGLTIGINSNLTVLNKEDALHLKKLGISLVLTSIMGPNSKIHDSIAKRKGAFSETVNGIRKLQKTGIPIAINMVVSQKNKEYVKDTARFVKSLGLNHFSATKVSWPGNCKDFSSLSLSSDEFHSYLQDLYEIGIKENMHVDVLESYPLCGIKEVNKFRKFTGRKCLAGVTTMTIGSNGDVRPCSHLDINYGNIFKDGLKNIWNRMNPWCNGDMLPSMCRSCSIFGLCGGGCRMEAKMNNKVITTLDPYAIPKNIPYVISQITSRKKKSLKPLPDVFRLNPRVRLRRENFGGTIFIGAKFACYLNKNGFQLIKGLKIGDVYNRKRISKFSSEDNSVFDVEKFFKKMFNCKVLIYH